MYITLLLLLLLYIQYTYMRNLSLAIFLFPFYLSTVVFIEDFLSLFMEYIYRN
jgi:hypothetical protein